MFNKGLLTYTLYRNDTSHQDWWVILSPLLNCYLKGWWVHMRRMIIMFRSSYLFLVVSKNLSGGQRKRSELDSVALSRTSTSRVGEESSAKNCSRPLHLTLKKSPFVVSFFLLVQLISSVHLATGELILFFFFFFSSLVHLLHVTINILQTWFENYIKSLVFRQREFCFCSVYCGWWTMIDWKLNKTHQNIGVDFNHVVLRL